MTTAILTALALIAFAANSLLCRMALGESLIDPATFTAIRLASGVVALVPISWFFGEYKSQSPTKGSWSSGIALFAYAAAFSWAYVSLDTGTGALILFGTVQITMVSVALLKREVLSAWQWVGMIAAVAGLVYLLFPGLSAPNSIGAVLMCLSGIAWGIYSVRGQRAGAPIDMTTGNFLRATPFTIVLLIFAMTQLHADSRGIVLAVISGSITSGVGYVIWYKALRGLTTTQASVVQLLVPVIAAIGGITFLSEQVTVRLVFASALILGGVCLAAATRERHTPTSETGRSGNI